MRMTHAAREVRREVIRQRLARGEGARELAAEYGLTLTYIYAIGRGAAAKGKAVLAGKRRAQLREFHWLGMTQADFVRRSGLSQVRVSQMAASLGLKFRKDTSGWEPVIKAARSRAKSMATLYRAGYTLQQIADQYGITRERVRQLLGKYEGMAGRDGGASARAAAKAARRIAARNQKYIARHGCSFDAYNSIPAKAKAAYRNQRSAAHHRGVGWELKLWQWWTIWQESGHWPERGRGQGYVMCRKGDEGPYAVGNVFIATAIENSSTGKQKKSGLPTGVRVGRNGRFVARRMLGSKMLHLGTFDTPDMAYAAYLMAAEPARAA